VLDILHTIEEVWLIRQQQQSTKGLDLKIPALDASAKAPNQPASGNASG